MLKEMLLQLSAAVEGGDTKTSEKLYSMLRRGLGMDKATVDYLLKNRRLWDGDSNEV